ncbi:hypothetical protein KP509_11G078000 [Ceratopteris richardii]|uniref:Uncharacterized protein n=1 Tax=Ceratopteris richardii TaxID=49495 RepID=A0A8T2TZR2_CERRI|nr:hypothetical protein KP509_11G078000 [Ceratopteris richardii]
MLQDGFNLQLSKPQNMRMGEYENPIAYKDDFDQELLIWLAGISQFECYMMHIDSKKGKTNNYLDVGILEDESNSELVPTIEVRHSRKKVEALRVELQCRCHGLEMMMEKEPNLREMDVRVELEEVHPNMEGKAKEVLANGACILLRNQKRMQMEKSQMVKVGFAEEEKVVSELVDLYIRGRNPSNDGTLSSKGHDQGYHPKKMGRQEGHLPSSTSKAHDFMSRDMRREGHKGKGRSGREKWCIDNDGSSEETSDRKRDLLEGRDKGNQNACEKRTSRHEGLKRKHTLDNELERGTISKESHAKGVSNYGSRLKKSRPTRAERCRDNHFEAL